MTDPYVEKLLRNAVLRNAKVGPLLDLSQVPSAESRAGLLSGEIRNYDPTWSDYAREAEKAAAGIATDAPRAAVTAYDDPSIANLTNAGVQTALTFGRPMAAGGALVGGLLSAGLSDAGAFDSSANAADESDPLGTQRKRFERLQKKAAKGIDLEPAEKREYETYLKTLNDAATAEQRARLDKEAADAAAIRERQTKEADAKMAEERTAKDTAIRERDKALARDVRFGDTKVGQVWNEVGGAAPLLGAYLGGAVSRLGTGPGKTLGSKILNDYLLPAVGGAGVSFAAQNVSDFADSNAPAANPQKEAYLAYARELPDGPEKEKWLAYAQAMPDQNPVKEEAQRSRNDEMAHRALVAAIEGVSLGKLGAATVSAGGRAASALRGLGGGGGGAPTSPVGPGPAPGASQSANPYAGRYQTYPDLPGGAKGEIRSGYLDNVNAAGGLPIPKLAAPALQNEYAAAGVNVPITARRIKATNDAVEAFAKQNGRMPKTVAELQKFLSNRTLAVPLATGATAGPLLFGEDQ